MTDIKWGAPLTGAQMKLLRAAGLPDETEYQFQGMWSGQWQDGGRAVQSEFLGKNYRLPANHPAYALLEAGWLDGRNVALWFGGEKAPDDLSEGADVLFRGGVAPPPLRSWTWRHLGIDGDIIAYIRKAEGLITHADRVLADAERAAKRMGGELGQNELWGEAAKADEQTVTIAKMTEADSREWCGANFGGNAPDCWEVLNALNLIKTETTRLERFWRSKCREGELWEDIIKEALEFERD